MRTGRVVDTGVLPCWEWHFPSWRFLWCQCCGNMLSLWQTSLPSPTEGIPVPLGELLTWVSSVGNSWMGSRGHWDAAAARPCSPAQCGWMFIPTPLTAATEPPDPILGPPAPRCRTQGCAPSPFALTREWGQRCQGARVPQLAPGHPCSAMAPRPSAAARCGSPQHFSSFPPAPICHVSTASVVPPHPLLLI